MSFVALEGIFRTFHDAHIEFAVAADVSGGVGAEAEAALADESRKLIGEDVN